jgi:hypothetical protein
LCRKRKPEKAVPYLLEALKENPDNLDAVIQVAFLMDRPSAVETLEHGETMGNTVFFLPDKLLWAHFTMFMQDELFSSNA